ncbi:MAG: hypothetical protein ACFE9T_08685 [Promethearchaeota archaeon]
MSKAYSNFMIYHLKDTGEREKLNITEQEFRQNNGSKILHESQVALIIKEDIRRIYIWNGMTSPVRKKFIASRVATELQQELIFSAKFHRCKIVSVDQGDEPLEFLNAFGFDSPKRGNTEQIDQPQFVGLNNQNKYNASPQIKTQNIVSEKQKSSLYTKKKQIASKPTKKVIDTTVHSQKEILDKVLSIELPKDHKRASILIGNNTLYGIIVKKAEIFGKPVEETVWEPLKTTPKEIIELEGHKLRVHFNNKSNNIEAIEVLEKISKLQENIEKGIKETQETDYNKWTVKQLKEYCANNNIKVPSSYRKAQIINLVKEFSSSQEI